MYVCMYVCMYIYIYIYIYIYGVVGVGHGEGHDLLVQVVVVAERAVQCGRAAFAVTQAVVYLYERG